MSADELKPSNRAACSVGPNAWSAEAKGLAWVIGAFVICPCHLPLILAVVTAVLSGTAVGVFLTGHTFIAGTIVALTWAAATGRGIYYLRSDPAKDESQNRRKLGEKS